MDLHNYLLEEIGPPTDEQEIHKRIRGQDCPFKEGTLLNRNMHPLIKDVILESSRTALRNHYDSLSDDDFNGYIRDKPRFEAREKYLAFLVENIRAETPRTVIEGGCGRGHDAVFIAGEFPGVHFDAYDISERNIESAIRRAEKYDIRNAGFSVSPHEDFSFPKGTEMIYLHSAFGEERKIFIGEEYIDMIDDFRMTLFTRALKKGGSLIISFYVPKVTLHMGGGYYNSFGPDIENHGFKPMHSDIIYNENGRQHNVFHYKKS